MAGKKRLNKEQLAAVRHGKGPLLIIAGAGTGKTTVITDRIRYLISKDLAKPSEILALTFTGKAAREMEERVDIAMPYGYTQMWISTFHSFCDRVLRAEALHIGLDPKYKLTTEAEAVQFIRSNLFKFELDYFRPLGNPTKFVGGMLQHFSRLQDEDIAPNDYIKWVEKQRTRLRRVRLDSGEAREEKIEVEKWLELAKAYKVYDGLKVKEGVADFGDLIVKTLTLFRKRPNVLNIYKKQFKYVLVDEYQDTNISQNELVKLLAGKAGNITVVLDDDQSIYRFRGAAISNAIQFRKTFPKSKIVTLIKNYRSGQKILDKAYQLIQYNNPDRLEFVEKIDKKLISAVRDKGKDVRFIHEDRVENEAEEVAKEIESLISKSQINYKDISILVRANNHSEPFIRAFQRHSIPYQFLGPGRLFKQSEIIDLISYLKVLYNFEDSVSFYRLLSIDYFKIPAKDMARIGNYARRYSLSIFEACERINDVFVPDKTKDKIKLIIKIIEKHLKLIRKETAGQVLYYFLEDTGLLQKILNPDSAEADKKVTNVSKFFDKLKTYEVDHEDATVMAVVDWIELSSELGESPLAADMDWTEVNAVSILTVHSAKGLEFPVVFLVNLVSQRFPTIERREQIPIPDDLIKEILPEGDFHEQEERRLFYVGMTRAESRLYFTAANYYGEGKREKRLSPFIFEALGDEAIASEQSTVDSKQLSFLDYKPMTSRKLMADSRQPAAKLHIDFLSFSQINTFRICPLHYKLRYILKIPTPPSAPLSFGTSMHATMKDFYNKVASSAYAFTKNKDKPTTRFINKLLKDNWLAQGYDSKSHEKRMFERGQKYLKGYLKKGFDTKTKAVGLEQSFVVPLRAINPTGSEVARPLKVGGKIDRVDRLRGGNIEIIDYKTGERVPDQRTVDNDLQLTFYALAASSIKEPPFDKKPDKIKLSLYFFKEQKKILTTRTKKQLDDAVKEIFEWRKKIEKSDFKCSKNYLCRSCEYKLMCQVEN